jgi:Ca2+-binding EF-hand superfamily protein
MTVDAYSSYGSIAYSSYNTSSSAKVSREELADALFKTIDSDESEGIDRVEFSQAALELSNISDEEALEEAFAAMDSDEDGALSFDELLSGLEASMQTGAVNAPPPPPPPPSSSSSSDSEEDDETDSLEALASDDSYVTDAADTDGDGVVTTAEAMAYQASLNEEEESTKSKNLMQYLMSSVIASYSNYNSTSETALNLSA